MFTLFFPTPNYSVNSFHLITVELFYFGVAIATAMLISLRTSDSLYRFIGAQMSFCSLFGSFISLLDAVNGILDLNENAFLVCVLETNFIHSHSIRMVELKATHLTDYYVWKVGHYWPVNSASKRIEFIRYKIKTIQQQPEIVAHT